MNIETRMLKSFYRFFFFFKSISTDPTILDEKMCELLVFLRNKKKCGQKAVLASCLIAVQSAGQPQQTYCSNAASCQLDASEST